MTDQDSRAAKIVEPLAKFHARVLYNGRIAIPENTRKRYGFNKGDWVELLIRKTEMDGGPIIGRGHFFARLSNKGLITIPKGLRKELDINEKDIVEVIVLDFFKIETILKTKSAHTSKLVYDRYEVLDEEAERLLFLRN